MHEHYKYLYCVVVLVIEDIWSARRQCMTENQSSIFYFSLLLVDRRPAPTTDELALASDKKQKRPLETSHIQHFFVHTVILDNRNEFQFIRYGRYLLHHQYPIDIPKRTSYLYLHLTNHNQSASQCPMSSQQ